MSENCKELVAERGAWGERYPCARKAVTDGYCKQHHPDSVKARDKATRDRWAEESKVNNERWDKEREDARKARAYDALMANLVGLKEWSLIRVDQIRRTLEETK